MIFIVNLGRFSFCLLLLLRVLDKFSCLVSLFGGLGKFWSGLLNLLADLNPLFCSSLLLLVVIGKFSLFLMIFWCFCWLLTTFDKQLSLLVIRFWGLGGFSCLFVTLCTTLECSTWCSTTLMTGLSCLACRTLVWFELIVNTSMLSLKNYWCQMT